LAQAHPDLRREIESLLAERRAEGGLDTVAPDLPNESAATLLAPGLQLGPYKIEAPIGAGGMGAVYRARDTRLGREVAVKLSARQFGHRFQREACAIAALNHPNVCQVYDVGPNYLVMEYIEGSPLAPVGNPRKLIDLAVQIADGLSAAHAAGFVHRDLKPDNILVTREGRVKILDFGLAKRAGVSVESETITTTSTTPGTVLGTVAYMSPEQAQGVQLDARSDQFSFGVILYEMASGMRPFKRASAAETMAAIIREEPEALPPGVPPLLRWLIERCMSKDPAGRYDSTRDLYRELCQVREHLLDATTPETRRRSSGAVLGAAAAMMIGFAIAALWPVPLPEPAQPVPLATESELQAMPRWSPKGDRIAYVASVDGVLQVFTRSLNSSTPTQITREAESCMLPFWSPDGSRIYYLTRRRPNTGLRSVAVAGGASETVLDGVYRADLSPDGKTLAVLAQDTPGSYRLALSSPPGAPPIPYSRPPLSNFRDTGTLTTLSFDRSGKYLGLFTSVRQLVEFWKIPMSGGLAEEMLGGKGNGTGHFSWLNNSAGIITDSLITGSQRLERIDFGSRVMRLLTTGALRDITPALSPDGSNLAFASGEAGYDIIDVPLTGAPPREMIATGQSELGPAWAPDGVRFAYVTDRSGAPEIWFRNRVDGSERLILGSRELRSVGALFDCAVSPDGTRVAYRAHRAAEVGIWVSPLSGEAPVRLWDDPARSVQRGPSWSPDGNWIAYYGARGGRPALMKARVGANAPAEFLGYMSRNEPVRWSPRGDWIVFRDGESLRIISPDGKRNRVISEHVWETYGWSKDGAMLYGIGYNGNGRLVVASVDLASERETQIADLGPPPPAFYFAEDESQLPYRGFSLHPDGKSFLTSVFRAKTQIYLLRDFDRTARLMDRWWKR
jgi:serine/threonine protein kinase